MWVTKEYLLSLPRNTAYSRVVQTANALPKNPILNSNNSNTDVQVLAAAYSAIRDDSQKMKDRAIIHLSRLDDVSVGSIILPVARNLTANFIAAKLLDYDISDFARKILNHKFAKGHGGADTLYEMSAKSTNNHGCMARAAVAAIGIYLDDNKIIDDVTAYHMRWLGFDNGRNGLKFTSTNWHVPYSFGKSGINKYGAVINGCSVDGVLPEDQRRSSKNFKWPPPKENYVWGALQGAVLAHILLVQKNKVALNAVDDAILRSITWLNDICNFPASGDDTWIPWVVNKYYNEKFKTEPVKIGKNMAFTDWTHN